MLLPRRLRFTRGGVFFSLGALATGAAAVHSGNNLLFLLLGAMVGVILVSGVLSERVLRGLRVERNLPPGSPLQVPFPVRYRVRNTKRLWPSLAVTLTERGLTNEAFVMALSPGASCEVGTDVTFVRRGVYPLDVLVLSTAFPFGLFAKERRVKLAGELVVWPRTDLHPPDPWAAAGSGSNRRQGKQAGRPGARGEFETLREYRTGDDVRDIHWRSSARIGRPVVRSYLDEAGEVRWLALDTSGPDGEAAELALGNLASLARRLVHAGTPFGLLAGGRRIEPGRGLPHLETVLDVLARVDFESGGPAPDLDDVPVATYSTSHPDGTLEAPEPAAVP